MEIAARRAQELADQERAARLLALFQAGRLARDSSGSFLAPDPSLARIADLLEQARGRQISAGVGKT